VISTNEKARPASALAWADLHQQGVAFEFHARQVAQARQHFLQAAPPHGAFLMHAIAPLGKDVEPSRREASEID
jgi:hypothetical protein